jgi:hypothetical protein
MMKISHLPNAKEFVEFVEKYEKKHVALDMTYLKALRDFKKLKPNGDGQPDIKSILQPYLLKWGRMGRVLGYKGCNRITEKLEEMANQLAELIAVNLTTVDVRKRSHEIEALYNSILNAKWKSEKGKTKRVGPTATSKVLHLVNPDLFLIWDSKIRKTYGFKDSGVEHVRFLASMQKLSKKLCSVVENLQAQYEKSITKILDEYNWKKCWG